MRVRSWAPLRTGIAGRLLTVVLADRLPKAANEAHPLRSKLWHAVSVRLAVVGSRTARRLSRRQQQLTSRRCTTATATATPVACTVSTGESTDVGVWTVNIDGRREASGR